LLIRGEHGPNNDADNKTLTSATPEYSNAMQLGFLDYFGFSIKQICILSYKEENPFFHYLQKLL